MERTVLFGIILRRSQGSIYFSLALVLLASLLIPADVASADYDFAIGRGLPLFRHKELAASRPWFEKALETAQNPEQQADALLLLGHTYFYENAYNTAAGFYRKALEISGASQNNLAHANLYLAGCYFYSGDYASAAAEYSRTAGITGADSMYRIAAQEKLQKAKEHESGRGQE